MPVEIREIIIRAVALPDEEDNQPQPEANQEAIVQECVRQVMNILRKKEER